MLRRGWNICISRHSQALLLLLGIYLLLNQLPPAPSSVKTCPLSLRLTAPHTQFLAGLATNTEVHVLDLETMQVLAKLEHPVGNIVIPHYFSQDGRYVAVACYLANENERSLLHIWKIEQQIETLVIRSSGNAAIAFSPDTTKIVVADDYHLQPNEANRHSLGVWSLHTGERLQTLRDTRQELITKLAWSHDGKWIVSSSIDGAVRIWDAESGQQLRCLQHSGTDDDFMVAFSINGQHVMAWSMNKQLEVWRLSDGSLISTIETKNTFKPKSYDTHHEISHDTFFPSGL